MNIEKLPGEGKGWGDGKAVRDFNMRRKTVAENTYSGFRPRLAQEPDWFWIKDCWAADERVNKSLSSIINSLLPYIKVACEHTTEIDTDGHVSIELNIGRIIIK